MVSLAFDAGLAIFTVGLDLSALYFVDDPDFEEPEDPMLLLIFFHNNFVFLETYTCPTRVPASMRMNVVKIRREVLAFICVLGLLCYQF